MFFQMGWFNHQLVTVCLNTHDYILRINVDDGSMSSIVITHLHLARQRMTANCSFQKKQSSFLCVSGCYFLERCFLRCFLLSNKNMSLFIAGLLQDFLFLPSSPSP